jgi:hypothetical protein
MMAIENDFNVNSHLSDVADNEFYVMGYGGYGASDLLNWWGSIDHAELVVLQSFLGVASAYVKFNVDNTGKFGNVLYRANASSPSVDTLYYYSNQSYAWSTNNGWNNDGIMVVTSKSVWYTFLDWTASGSFNYGDNKYYITAVENNFHNDATSSDICSNEFFVVVSGGYGASSPLVW